MDMIERLVLILIGIFFGWLLTFLSITILNGKEFTKDKAIENGHAIYAPDTGKFTWLPKGDGNEK